MSSYSWALPGSAVAAGYGISTFACPDLKTLVGLQQGNRILAALNVALDLTPGLGEVKAGELLTRIGLELPDVVAKLGPAAAKALACASCFPAGTQVATPQGQRPIQALHAGDQVLAENPANGKVETEPVQAVIKDPVSDLLAVMLSDGSTIEVTANHPFWVDGNADFADAGWRAAGELQIGDLLRTERGEDLIVVGLHYHIGEAAVYTLTVANDHTFFVSAARVLVHNADCISAIETAQKESSFLQSLLPAGSQGRVTMAVGVVEDATGNTIILVGTSEANAYLRPAVAAAVQKAGYRLAPSVTNHAEQNIVYDAAQQGWRVIAVGAGRPVCPACVTAIENAGGIVATVKKK